MRIKMITKIIELGFSLGLFINAILFVSQAGRIFINKDAANLSFMTFFGFLMIQLVTTFHGFLHKDYLLACGTLLSMIACGSVIWLIMYYQKLKKSHTT